MNEAFGVSGPTSVTFRGGLQDDETRGCVPSHNWWERADLNLILQSVEELKELAERLQDRTFAMPLPGTGNGGLSTDQVWPLLTELPDNVVVVVYHRVMLPT